MGRKRRDIRLPHLILVVSQAGNLKVYPVTRVISCHRIYSSRTRVKSEEIEDDPDSIRLHFLTLVQEL